jgi:uncharacterized lipoprotein YehR (DUF1307 family)
MFENKKSITTLLLFLFFFTAINAQDDFEGKIKFKVTHDGDEMYLDYFIKGDNLRMEMGDNKEAAFIKTSDKSIVLMPSEKMYMDLDNSIFNNLPGMDDADDESDETVEDFNIEKIRTGKTKTILGYNCDQWIFQDSEDESEVEMWVTSDLGNFMQMDSPMVEGFSPGWGSSLSNKGFFPMLVITKDNNGEETSRFEATEVNKQTLKNDLFSPPSDYSEMKIPGMDGLFK